MLTGRPPYDGPTAVSIAVKHLNEPVPELASKRPDLPPALSDIVSRMMAKDVSDRYQSAEAVLNDIRRLMKAVRQAERPSQVDASALESVAVAPKGDRKLSQRSAITLLSVLLLITAGASAGVGWLTRPADPLLSPAATAPNISKKETAREQYKHAMFLGNNEDAWKAVINDWDPSADRLWIRQAQEQLALMYLQDRTRWDDAKKMLTTLESFSSESNRYRAEALAGQAALQAYQGQHQQAKNTLQSHLRPVMDELPEGSAWERLVKETQLLIQQEQDRHRK